MKAWLCPSLVASLALSSCRHITVSAHAVNAWKSGNRENPAVGGRGFRAHHLPFIDVEEMAQWQSLLLPVSARAEVLKPSPQGCKSR